MVRNSLNERKTIRRCFYKASFTDADTDTAFSSKIDVDKTPYQQNREISREEALIANPPPLLLKFIQEVEEEGHANDKRSKEERTQEP